MRYEPTPDGEQGVIPGAERRDVPLSRVRARRPQAKEPGRLFAQPEPEQLTVPEETGHAPPAE